MSNPIKAKLQGQDVMCKNKCGFYGNPEWQGYCSKCHRELHQKLKSDHTTKVSKKVQRSHSDVQDTLNLRFGKFEEKKKQQTEKRTKTIKSIIKRGHTLKETSSQSPSKDVIEVLQMTKDLQLKDATGKDIAKQIHSQLDVMGKYYDKTIDEQSEAMQDFYNFMFNRCETHPSYQDLSSEQVDELMDRVEKVLMTRLHRVAFQHVSGECEEKDLALQKRIRSLNWITPQHLCLNITEGSPEVRDLIDKAITDAIAVDSEIAPQEKIICIVNCSKSIFQIINLCQGVTASADEFLPAMVYIVLKANPPLLQSNIKYITSYSFPARLRSGEGAYYFTNLCCAVNFIENLTCESLSMSEDEFQRHMSGEIPAGHLGQNPCGCEGLRLMTQNLSSLTEMHQSDTKMLSEMLLKDELIKFEEIIRTCKSEPPFIISRTPYTVPSNTDMSLIPEILRNRVVFAPVEDILVDIEGKADEILPKPHSSRDVSIPETTPLPQIVDLSTIKSSNPIGSLASLRVCLPKEENAPPVDLVGCQSVVSIQELEYPELAPDKADDEVEFGPFESCDELEAGGDNEKDVVLQDPLSAQRSFEGEGLNLPPPLQPVVVAQKLDHNEKNA